MSLEIFKIWEDKLMNGEGLPKIKNLGRDLTGFCSQGC